MVSIGKDILGAWLLAGGLIAASVGVGVISAKHDASLPQGADIGRPGASVVLHEDSNRKGAAEAYEAHVMGPASATHHGAETAQAGRGHNAWHGL